MVTDLSKAIAELTDRWTIWKEFELSLEKKRKEIRDSKSTTEWRKDCFTKEKLELLQGDYIPNHQVKT